MVLVRVLVELDLWEVGVVCGMMKDVVCEEREMEDGMKGVGVVNLREEDLNGIKGEEGLFEEEGKVWGSVGRVDVICLCLDL